MIQMIQDVIYTNELSKDTTASDIHVELSVDPCDSSLMTSSG